MILPRARRLALLLAVGAAIGCDTVATQPITAPTPTTVPAGSAHDDTPAGNVLGPFIIPIPPDNSGGGGLAGTMTGMSIQPWTSYIVTVSGTTTVSTNPKACGLPGPFGSEGTYGPGGTSGGELAVSVGWPASGSPYVGLHYDGLKDAVSDTLWSWYPGELQVAKTGIVGEVSAGTCLRTGAYTLSGFQSVKLALLDGQELEVVPHVAVVKRGAPVSFLARSRGVPVVGPYWLFWPQGTGTGDCGTSGVNPCNITVMSSGTMRAASTQQGRLRSASAAVIVYNTFELRADKSSVAPQEPVVFTPIVDGAPSQAARWLWRAEDKTEKSDPCASIEGGECHYAPSSSGTMWAYTSDGPEGPDSASAHVTVDAAPPSCGGTSASRVAAPAGVSRSVAASCTPEPPALTIQMLPPVFPLPNGSFTTRDGENVIALHAELSDPSRNAEIQWEVRIPKDFSESTGPQAQPANGANTTLTIRSWSENQPSLHGSPRWQNLHSCPEDKRGTRSECASMHDGVFWGRKVIAYEVVAFVLDHGVRVSTTPLAIDQNPVDVLRQEYIDFAAAQVPPRDVVSRTAAAGYFTLNELLGTSDYANPQPGMPAPLGWIEQPLRDGLDSVRTDYGASLTISGGYRDPAHNWIHVHGDQGYNASPTSNHMFGYASDLRAGHDRETFYAISRSGARAGACMEPPPEFIGKVKGAKSLIEDYDHVHVDWIPNGCTKSWRDWGASLLPPPR